MADLVPEFERVTGHRVVGIYEPTNAIMARIKGGETSDVVILIKQSVEELKQAGKVAADSPLDVARTSLVVAVLAGTPKPDISTVDAFKKAMLDARSVARSEVGASGIHFTRVLERLGIAEQMRPKMKVVQGAARTGDLIVKGEAEFAVQMMSELLPIPGVAIVGPLPGDLNFQIVLTAAMDISAKQPAAATALIKYLAAPESLPILKKKGMEGI